jgi:tripartite-type tricarboxylate transporter receptor subunit TctC
MLYSSAGVGNQNHLAPEMFARAAGIKIVHVPHKGTAPAIISTMGGHVQMMLTSLSPVSTYIAGGRLRLLATAGTKRVAAFPAAPTLVESGYPDVVVLGWSGLVGPIGMPQDIRNKLARDIAAADVGSALAVTGRDFTPTSPEAFGAFIKAEMDRWSKVIRAVGLEHSQ